MPSALDYVNVAVAVVVVASYAYLVYSSRAIRGTLVSPLYRRRATGTALVAVAFLAIYLSGFDSANDLIGFIGGIAFFASTFILLYWIDSAIRSARGTDPLDRDTLKWSKVRFVIWAGVLGSVAFALVIGAYFSAFPSNTPSGFPDWANSLTNYLFNVPIYLTVFTGVVVIPLAARRSKDANLRKHLEWFFIFILIQLALQGGLSQLFGTNIANNSTQILIDGMAMLLGFYPLYQSAKKLVPLYKFTPTDGLGVPA